MGSPALSDAQMDRILSQLNAVAGWHYNHVTGGALSDGGTTQASGANTAPNVDLDVSQILDAVITGTGTELAASADVDADAGDQIDWDATSGVECRGAACLSRGVLDDTPQVEVVFGAVDAVGDAVAPTDAEISAFVGHDNWARLATFRLERTADTTITLDEIDHTARPSVTEFPANIAEGETEWANGGYTRVFPIVQDPPPSVP